MKLASLLACMCCAALTAIGQMQAPSQGSLLSAFFGLDRSLRITIATRQTCGANPGTDGMPVIFSSEVDASTLGPTDFRVKTTSGAIGDVRCATLQPADEPGELRTVLLIGQFGSVRDQPKQVEVVGDVLSRDGAINFRGAATSVIPLEAGPTLILAETIEPSAWTVGGRGDCPGEGVKTIVRATWAGGVTRPDGGEIGTREHQMYRVSIRKPDGGTVSVAPVSVGDLHDNDNNHELCLDVAGMASTVFFPAGALRDPNGDLNPDTQVAVSAPRANGDAPARK